MAAPATTYDSLRRDIRAGKLAPVYLLHGEEGYFIDALVKEFDALVPEEEKDFNEHIFYAPETPPGRVMDVCMQVPMMAERQVVIVKEGQAVRADELNRYHKYVRNPSPSTVLVICCRGAVAKGKDLMAAMKAKGVIFESKKIPDYNITPHISGYITSLGLGPDPKAVDMLHQHVGTDLSRLYNEIDKLGAILPKGARVSPEVVETYVGISKDYNNFELIDAIAARDSLKVYRIADYFRSNPKANPLVLTCAALFTFFADLLSCYYAPDRSEKGLMATLKLKYPVQLRRYRQAMSNYNAFQIIEIIHAIRQFDSMSKGNGSRRGEHLLFAELLHHILTAQGVI